MKKTKRLTSLVLACVMLISLLPATFASAANDDITLDFSELVEGATANITGANIAWPERYSAEVGTYGNSISNWRAFFATGYLHCAAIAQWENGSTTSGYNRASIAVNVDAIEARLVHSESQG